MIAVGNALGSSISKVKQRPLGTMEAKISLTSAFLLLTLGIVTVFFPRILAIPLGVILVWFAVSLFINSYQLYKQAKTDYDSPKQSEPKLNK